MSNDDTKPHRAGRQAIPIIKADFVTDHSPVDPPPGMSLNDTITKIHQQMMATCDREVARLFLGASNLHVRPISLSQLCDEIELAAKRSLATGSPAPWRVSPGEPNQLRALLCPDIDCNPVAETVHHLDAEHMVASQPLVIVALVDRVRRLIQVATGVADELVKAGVDPELFRVELAAVLTIEVP